MGIEERSKSMNGQAVSTGVVTVGTLLKKSELCIPLYQRPYKWTTANIIQLVEDIVAFSNKKSYRIGTVVIHKDENDKLNIVDGQQRCITLCLIIKAIHQHNTENHKIKNPALQNSLSELKESGFKPRFSNPVFINNIYNNYREIERMVAGFTEEVIDFFIHKCEFVQCVLEDVSEAFQFFDSQNARGKDLEPHDLLKAYHLREFVPREEKHKAEVTRIWEDMPTSDLTALFGVYLFRIKGWSKGESARYFTKKETSLFKGINIHKVEKFPYIEPLRIAHFYVDQFNSNFERDIEQDHKTFPFQLDQTIINGRRFFEMIAHYSKELEKFKTTKKDHCIIKLLNAYEGKNHTGDKYIRTIFDCALLYYLDKFGDKDIDRVIEKIFIWAYRVRLGYQVVKLATVDNYVLHELNLFRSIRDAHSPEEDKTGDR
jgi:hypothetical protein